MTDKKDESKKCEECGYTLPEHDPLSMCEYDPLEDFTIPEGVTLEQDNEAYVIHAVCNSYWIEDGDTAQDVMYLIRDLDTACNKINSLEQAIKRIGEHYQLFEQEMGAVYIHDSTLGLRVGYKFAELDIAIADAAKMVEDL